MKELVLALVVIISCPSLLYAERMEKIAAPELSMIQGRWEGKWQATNISGHRAGVAGSGSATLTIQEEKAVSTYSNRPYGSNLTRTITISGSEIIFKEERGKNIDSFELYQKPDGTKVLKGSFKATLLTGESKSGDVYLEQVPEKP